MRLWTIAAMAVLAGAGAAAGTERREKASDLTLSAGIGYGRLEANELVYEGAGRVSHLIWESEIPLVNLTGRIDLAHDFHVASRLQFGLRGNSFMADYDWQELSPGFDFNDWSDRSLHPGTRLDHYVDLDIALGRSFAIDPALAFDLHGGFKYTEVKWTAIGGSWIYSEQSFRDVSGNFAGDARLISYEQSLPGAFLGAGAQWRSGAWTFSGHVRAGLSIRPEARDHHIRRNLRLTDSYDTLPFLSLAARAEFPAGAHGSLYVAGSYDRYFRRRGSTLTYEVDTNNFSVDRNAAGADFQALTLHAGYRLRF